MLFYDSQSVINLSKNPKFHSRPKHIKVQHYWICEALEMKLLLLKKIHVDDNYWFKYDDKHFTYDEADFLQEENKLGGATPPYLSYRFPPNGTIRSIYIYI